MIAPLIHYIGTGFDQIKVASILTSLAIVALIMGTARQLQDVSRCYCPCGGSVVDHGC
jgi:hypothetical protein